MKLSPIRRQDILAAANDLDANPDSHWSEYWVLVTEKNKEYPFKQLTRKAYSFATGTEIGPDFFQSNEGYRDYIEKKFNYPISFKVRENIPFFSPDDLQVFSEKAGRPYNPAASADVATGEQLRKTIFAKTNTWARALNLDDFEVIMDNNWQARGYYSRYSWARIFKRGDRDKKIFFTVGVGGEEQALIYKLDCHYRSSNPDNALTPDQYEVFKRIVRTTDAWYEIYPDDLAEYNWERLIKETTDFILHYIPLYEEAIKAVWNIPIVKGTSNSLREQPVPPGIGQLPLRRRLSGGTASNPDYDGENKERKKIGDAGEALVMQWEQANLTAKGRPDLAAAVSKQPDWKGYDILSFLPDGQPRFIEVKTTTGSNTRPFYWTRNEKQTMLDNPASYCLYRLYNYDELTGSADYFTLEGDLSVLILEEPVQYLVHIK